MTDRVVTVSVGENYIRIAEAGLNKERLEVVAMGQVLSPFPFYDVMTDKVIDDQSKVIVKLFDSLKIKTKNVNVIIPDSVSFSQILEMPKLKEKELLSAIRYQADQFIPMPLEETALDLEILKEDKVNKKLSVLIVATPQILVQKIEKLIELSGLLPDSIENELSSTGIFLNQFYKPVDSTSGTIFVNFGPTSTSLYFFHHGMKLLIDSHNFKIGFNLFVKDVKSNLSMEEAKIVEALKTIGFGQGASVNLDQILKPLTSEILREIEKFGMSMKEKYKINSISQILMFNVAGNVLYFDKKIEAYMSIPTKVFDISPFIIKSPITSPNATQFPAFIPTLGGSIR